MLSIQDTLLLLLMLCMIGMAIIAVFYMRERRLTLLAYIGWGLTIALIPLVGPFLVILMQPGIRREPVH
jgi:hypothetical protein